jgi:hypothetical protein
MTSNVPRRPTRWPLAAVLAAHPPVITDPDSTIANSHHTGELLVRSFAASTTPVWRVTKISAVDDAGTSKRADGDLADLQVTGAQVDTTALQPLIFVSAPGQENVVFDGGAGVVLHYTAAAIEDLEPDSGRDASCSPAQAAPA